jgi:RNA polymerase sigma factor (sigma-70 family)
MATSQLNPIIGEIRRAVLRWDGAALTDGQLLEAFVSRKDEAAFEVLIHRHGPMVLGVCRRILRNHHDADDAFQATFLVLIRKAGTIVPRGMVANWLHGVAYRTALKARTLIARHRTRERQVTEMPEPETVQPDECWQDLQRLLDRELSGLPEKYRVPVVLCDLEGKTGKEAARQLGWPEGTVSSRLARGRVMLARRLSRHNLALSGGALAAVLSQNAVACLSPSVVSSTLKAASLSAAGKAVTAAVVPAHVIALTKGVLKAMFLRKLMTPGALLVAAVLLLTGVGAVLTPAQDKPPAPIPGHHEQRARLKWEYKALDRTRVEKLARGEMEDMLTEGLNVLGDQGWELVAVEPRGTTGGFGGFGGGAGGGGFGGGAGGPGGGAGGGAGAPGGGGFGGGVGGGKTTTYLFKRPK